MSAFPRRRCPFTVSSRVLLLSVHLFTEEAGGGGQQIVLSSPVGWVLGVGGEGGIPPFVDNIHLTLSFRSSSTSSFFSFFYKKTTQRQHAARFLFLCYVFITSVLLLLLHLLLLCPKKKEKSQRHLSKVEEEEQETSPSVSRVLQISDNLTTIPLLTLRLLRILLLLLLVEQWLCCTCQRTQQLKKSSRILWRAIIILRGARETSRVYICTFRKVHYRPTTCNVWIHCILFLFFSCFVESGRLIVNGLLLRTTALRGLLLGCGSGYR